MAIPLCRGAGRIAHGAPQTLLVSAGQLISNTMTELLLLARAWRFAAERHAHQRRKGEAAEPYVNHLAEVADLVARATEGRDANLIAAAVLHDTIEDTSTTRDELAKDFNADIAALVAEVTDDKSLEKARRKELQIMNASAKSARAKIVKLADKTSNLRSLANSPPADWDLARRREYLEWAERVVKGLRGTNAWLEERFDEVAARLRHAFDSTQAPEPSISSSAIPPMHSDEHSQVEYQRRKLEEARAALKRNPATPRVPRI